MLDTHVLGIFIESPTLEDVAKGRESLETHMPVDITAICLKDILERLAEITGENVSEDIINEIFKKFCLGK